MKRGVLVILILLIAIISVTLIIRINTKPKAITGEATTQEVALNITVVGPPTITIHTPKNNQTYLSLYDIKMNTTILNANNIWHRVNNGSNISSSDQGYFNASQAQGSYTFHVYANNSYGESYANVTFSIWPNKIVIKDDKYEESEDPYEDQGNMTRKDKKGESTDFLDYSYEELQNLSNLTLHNPNSGKIKFLEVINITDDSNSLDSIIDLNSYTNISFNRIELNTTALPNFNKPATLALYNLNFTNPRILKDGIVCHESICTIQSYSGGALSFMVTGFSAYSAEESPSSATTGAAIEETEEAGGLKPEDFFSTDKDEIKIKLKQGESKIEQIIIKNTRSAKLSFAISSTDSQGVINIEKQAFELEPGEEKTITIKFSAENETLPGLYASELIITGGLVKKEIPILAEVETKKSILDASLDIPQRQAVPGEMLSFNLELQNLEETNLETSISYIIKDGIGNTIIFEKEITELEREKTIIKSIKIPENFNLGRYVLYVKVEYNGQTASASEWFLVVKERKLALKERWVLYLIFLIIGISLIVIAYKLKKLKRKK